jgi:hypothetical protein
VDHRVGRAMMARNFSNISVGVIKQVCMLLVLKKGPGRDMHHVCMWFGTPPFEAGSVRGCAVCSGC